jgi:hypothetical protein
MLTCRLAAQKGVDLIEQVFGWLFGGDAGVQLRR